MLDKLITPNDPGAYHSDPTIFRKRSLHDLLRVAREGYAWAKGIHLYSELRPVEGLQIAETDATAQKFLKIIEEYAHAALTAANLFGIELLELQGTVLHFHKEGEFDAQTVKRVLAFAYVFTKVLYETLAEDLEGDWHGFAICMDYGESVIVRHGRNSNSSSISLGPSANRPAKRLLYGKTAAGHAEFPGSWVNGLLGIAHEGEWYALNLRDRDQLQFLSQFENATLEAELRRIILEHRSDEARLRASTSVTLLDAGKLIDERNFSTDRPLRMRSFCMRADLDGFSKIVQSAFEQGDEAVEAVAEGFLKILEFGDFYEKNHYGVVRLPWAGDCVPFLIPPSGEIQSFRGQEWIAFVEEWQSFASDTPDGRKNRWNAIFREVDWSIGMSYAESGCALVASVETLSRKFLIGAGAPLAIASGAQNLGKGKEVVIHATDYSAAYPMVRKRFEKIVETEFWRTKNLTLKKVREAALEFGRAEHASKVEFIEKAQTVTVPSPRPYCP
jgi:hypothetical protein